MSSKDFSPFDPKAHGFTYSGYSLSHRVLLISTSMVPGFRVLVVWQFYMGCCGLNSGLHTFTANILLKESSPWPHFYFILFYYACKIEVSFCYFHTYLFLTDFSIPLSSPLSHYLLKSLMSQIPFALSYHMCLLPPYTSILWFIWPFSGNSL